MHAYVQAKAAMNKELEKEAEQRKALRAACVDVCVDMCMGMHEDMHVDMCIVVSRHVLCAVFLFARRSSLMLFRFLCALLCTTFTVTPVSLSHV